MINAAARIQEISSFLKRSRFRAEYLEAEPERAKQCYRRLHGLLIIELIAMKAVSGSSRAFLKEGIGDASQAFLLASCNLYKPSLLCLRSAIENVLRFVIAEEGKNPDSIKTVYELFKLVRAKYVANQIAVVQLGRLTNEYETLCETSHTVKETRMSGEVSFERLTRYYSSKANDAFARFSVTSTGLLNFLFIYFHNHITDVDATNGDDLRRLVPRSLRRSLSA
jgi:hypothetical protein